MMQSRSRQQGAVLIVGLVVLVILTVLGLSGMSNTVVQERMAGNLQERLSAFQAAEAGLRDGEEDVRANMSLTTVFRSSCDDGLCEPADTGYDVWFSTANVLWDDTTPASDVNTRLFGSATGAMWLKNVSRQPAYIIERLNIVERGASLVEGFGRQNRSEWYRVTSKGFGRDGQSQTLVQSVVRR